MGKHVAWYQGVGFGARRGDLKPRSLQASYGEVHCKDPQGGRILDTERQGPKAVVDEVSVRGC